MQQIPKVNAVSLSTELNKKHLKNISHLQMKMTEIYSQKLNNYIPPMNDLNAFDINGNNSTHQPIHLTIFFSENLINFLLSTNLKRIVQKSIDENYQMELEQQRMCQMNV